MLENELSNVLEKSAPARPRISTHPFGEALRPFVAEVGIVEGGIGVPDLVLVPNACASLVFRIPHPTVAEQSEPGLFAVGPRRALLRKPLTDTARTVAVRFRPGGAALFFGVPLRELTDCVLSIEELWGTDGVTLSERLVAASGVSAVVAVIEETLFARMRCARRVERESAVAARRAVRLILRSPVLPTVGQLAREFGMNDRTLRRIFAEAVGISPKAFLRAVRLNRLLDAMQRHPPSNWAAIAVQAGYYDQSHMIAEFRGFTGTTPAAFYASSAAPTRRLLSSGSSL